MEDNWVSGFLLHVALIPDTSFTGGFEIMIQLSYPADLTVSDNEICPTSSSMYHLSINYSQPCVPSNI